MKSFYVFAIALALGSIATSAAAQEKDAAQSESLAEKPPKKTELHFQLESGPVIGSFADVSFFGADVGAGLHVAPNHLVAFDAELFYAGATSNGGLGFHWGGARTTFLWTPSRLRIGAGADLLYFGMERVTENSALTHPGVGVHAHVGFDIIELDGGHALELFVQPEANWLFGVPLLTGSVELAARF